MGGAVSVWTIQCQVAARWLPSRVRAGSRGPSTCLERGGRVCSWGSGLLSSGPHQPRQTWVPAILHSIWILSPNFVPNGGAGVTLPRPHFQMKIKPSGKIWVFPKFRYQMSRRQTVQLLVRCAGLPRMS